MMKTTTKPELELYGGRVRLRFTPSGHRYKISLDGGDTWSAKVGVTTVLGATVAKDGLLPWAAGLAADTLLDLIQSHLAAGSSWDELDTIQALELAKGAHIKRKGAGADIGTIVHAWIEAHIKGDNLDLPEAGEAIRAINGFLDWERTHQPEWLSLEQPVYSREHDFCGTYDAIARIDGKVVVLDFKTGNARYDKGRVCAYPEHFIQIGGYSLAHTEESTEAVDRHGVLYIQKDGAVHYFDTDQVAANEQAFLHALELYRHLQELKYGL